MGFVVFLAITLLITLLTTYMVIENNRKKAIALEKKQQNERIEVAANRFKSVVSNLGKLRVVKPRDTNLLQQISSHYFVMQPKNDKTIAQYEQTINLLADVFEQELDKHQLREDKHLFAKNVYLFMAELPKAGHQYTAEFYLHELPSLNHILVTLDEQIESDPIQELASDLEPITENQTENN